MPGIQSQILGQRVYTYGGVGNEGQPLGLGGGVAAPGVPVRALLKTPLVDLPTIREKLDYLYEKRRHLAWQTVTARSLAAYR